MTLGIAASPSATVRLERARQDIVSAAIAGSAEADPSFARLSSQCQSRGGPRPRQLWENAWMTDTVSVMSGTTVATWTGVGTTMGAGATYEPATRNSWQNAQCAGSSGADGEFPSRFCESATFVLCGPSALASAPIRASDSGERWICVCVTKLETKKLRSANAATKVRKDRIGAARSTAPARYFCLLPCRNDVGLASFAIDLQHVFGPNCNKWDCDDVVRSRC